MNNMPGAPMGGTWHSKQNPEERQKIISIVVSTLKELQGSNFNEASATKMAHDFEKYVFMKAPSRDDYLTAIKQKMHQMRGSLRNNQSQGQGQGPNGGQLGQKQQMQQPPPQFQNQAQQQAQAARQAQQQAQAQQQSQQQHQQPQGLNVGMNGDVGFFPQTQMRPSQSPQQNFQQAPQGQMGRQNQQQQQQQQQPLQQGLQQKMGPGQQGQGGPGGQGVARNGASQLTPQQAQQLTAMIKNVPIPAVFLSKIPNLPPNVNTWAKIFELAQQKMIPQSSVAAIKEVHQAHLNIVMHQQQQRIAQRRTSSMNPGQNVNPGQAPSNDVQSNMGNMGNMNSMGNLGNVGGMANMNMNSGMNNMTNMNSMGVNNGGMNMSNMNNMNRQGQQSISIQNQRIQQQMQQNALKNNTVNKAQGAQNNMSLPMGLQHPPQSQQQNLQSQQNPMLKQQQQMSGSQSGSGLAGETGNGQQQQAATMKMPNFQITSQDIMTYQSEALAYLNRAQQEGKIPPNLDNEGKQNFIRKYIYHQKATAWKNEQMKKGNAVPTNMAMQNQQRSAQQSSMQMGNMNQGGFPPQQQLNQQQQQQQRQPQQPQHQAMNSMSQNMGQIQQSPMMGNLQQPPSSTVMSQAPSQPMYSPVMQQNVPGQGAQGGLANMAGQPNQNQIRRPQGMPPITDEMKMKLRALYDEVARGDNLQSKNISMSLSDKDKLRFKELVGKVSQQYANVDSVLSYYYALTRDLSGTKKLIQMKFMTKNMIENYHKGIYLARPELLEKMTQHFQKYFDSVRKELIDRRQQQQQQQQQQPQATSQMSPAQQRPAMNQPAGQVLGQRPGMQTMNQVDQRFMPQNMNQNNQQNFVPSGMNQMPMGQNLQQQTPQNQTPQQLASQRMQQQTQQQFARNATHAQIAQGQPDWSKAVNANQRAGVNISPMPGAPTTTSPIVQPQPAPRGGAAAKPVKKASTSSASGRRKSTKAAGTMPTPGNSAPTPATLANAIKTPNSMPTPQVIQSNSNKGTPIDVSPNSDNKLNNMMAKEPIVGDVFGGSKNMADEKSDSRRELSKTNPEEFFFAALSNLLETDKAETAGDAKAIAEHTASPLSPNLAGWTCTVKPEAITSAFCQIDYIKDLTAVEVLDQCAKLVERDAKRKEESLNSKKRTREEPDDIDMLFDEADTKKLRTGDFDRYMYEPVDLEEWKSWLTGLQSTEV